MQMLKKSRSSRFFGGMSTAGSSSTCHQNESGRVPDETASMRAAELYLDLLKRVLTGLMRPQLYAPAPLPQSRLKRAVFTWLSRYLSEKGKEIVRRVPFDPSVRQQGVDWPVDAETMVGTARLENVQQCIRSVVRDGIAGDLIETGVWRGGTCIFMRACLEAYGDREKIVWLADSFQGLPPPDPEKYPADTGDLHSTWQELAVSRTQVEENFRRYGLLDDRVRFIEGWFRDTLPGAPVEKLAVLRLDGDMYESTMDALTALYPRLSVGGYCIIDDYLWHKPCAQAVEDYRKANGISEPIQKIDVSGVFWRRER